MMLLTRVRKITERTGTFFGIARRGFAVVAYSMLGSSGTFSKHSLLRNAMLVVTTETVEGKPIKKHLGLVSGEAILGANIFRDFFAGIRDIVGGRSAAYEEELRKAKDIAIQEMQQQAAAMGGNAVVGVDLDYENITVGASGGMLMVSASGTAVVL